MTTAATLGAASLSTASALNALPALTRAIPMSAVSNIPAPTSDTPADVLAQDEAYWQKVASQYQVTPGVINLEAGYFGLMSLPVLEAFKKHSERANRDSSYFARREFPAIQENARRDVARFIGAAPEEIVFTRNATEALQALISQYNNVGPGDTIMYADIDYNAMQYAMNGLAAATGAKRVVLDIPEPATFDSILQTYTRALDANPRTRLLLLTHCNNKSGTLLPVREIVAIARERGVDTVVDAAHSFGQVPLSIADLDAEFVGLNLHKWIGTPIGAGVMYIRPDKLNRIDRAHADESAPATSIESRIHTGTANFATIMTVPDALAFQREIGLENKAARLRYLRNRWVKAVRESGGVQILTGDDPRLTGAITSFRMAGRGDAASNKKAADTLLDEYSIFTTTRTGLAKGDCVRVTPSLYNSSNDVDQLARALKEMAARG